MKSKKEFTDLRELFTKGNSDKGIWKQVAMHGKKWNIDVLLLGKDSDEYQFYQREKMKELQKNIKANGGTSIELDDDTIDDMFENKNDDALVLFNGIRLHNTESPLILDGQEVPMEKTDDCEKVYDNILTGMPELKDWIMKQASDRTNFLSFGKKN